MKRLVVGIFAAFAVLLGVSVYIAEKMHDGTVEEDYYRKSLDYFRVPRANEAGIAAYPSRAVADAGSILFDVSPKPVRAMRELVFTVEIPGETPSGAPWIDLGMAGMAMPPNRVALSAEGNGRFRGKGVVVRCRSGGRSWTATVNIPGRGSVPFTFDVSD